jgi:hypothetical protein
MLRIVDRIEILAGTGSVAAIVLLAVAGAGCLFDLEDVRVRPGGVADAGTDARADVDADVSTDDVLEAAVPIDGCWPPTDAVFCASHGVTCGEIQGVDECGQARVVVCGACGVDAACVQGICVGYVYVWVVGSWSDCSASCDGGVQTRDVWCGRDDGALADESKCAGSKPAESESCNTHSCCTPSCVSHDACGGDGCGGSCGTCDYDLERSCRGAYCVWSHGNNSDATCHEICFWGGSQCVDTSVGSCGEKIVTECYCW